MRTKLTKISNLFSGLLLLGMTVGLVGCSQDDDQKVLPSEDGVLRGAYEVSNLFGESTTREAATTAEKELKNMYAVFFSNSTKAFVSVKKATITNNNFSIEVPQKGVSYDIKLIANVEKYSAGATDFVSWLTTQMGEQTYAAAALVATAPSNALIVPELLMHGAIENSIAYTGATIKLTRNIAKVNVTTAANIKLDASKGAYLCNTTSQTEVFGKTEVLSSGNHVNQFGQVITDNNKVATANDHAMASVYLFPRTATGKEDVSNTCLSIYMERTDAEFKGWYRLNLLGSDNKINSNYLYNVNVSKLGVHGSTDPGDVFDDKPLNVTGDVNIDWDDEDVVVGDGVNWLQVKPRTLTLYKDKRSGAFEIADNFADGVALTAEGLQEGGYFTATSSADNKTLTISVPTTLDANAKATFNVRKGTLYIPVTVEYKNIEGNEAEIGTGGDTDEGFENGGEL